MTTLFLLDDHNCCVGEQTLQDPYGPLPKCVMQAPPELTGTEAARWYGAGWEVLPQHPRQAAVVDAKVAAIKDERDRRIQTGGYQAGTKWFHSDTFSRTQQMGLVILGANIPSGTQWKTLDGTFVTMTQALAGQIFAAAAAKDIATFAAAEAHIAAVQSSAEPLGYDFSGGWPATYQDSELT